MTSCLPSTLAERDVVLIIPMNGMINRYLCQLGRAGTYMSVALVRTMDGKAAPCNVHPRKG